MQIVLVTTRADRAAAGGERHDAGVVEEGAPQPSDSYALNQIVGDAWRSGCTTNDQTTT